MGRIHLGTSGYVYQHWRGLLYPKGLAPRLWLARYQQLFETVELNATFYRLPSAQMVANWRAQAPPGFLYACKGSRFLTHMKRLLDTDVGLRRYFDLLLGLGDKLGPVLWQLPPQMDKCDLPRLIGFLEALPRQVRHAFEFRHPAWYEDDVCDVLDAYGAAFCEHDLVARAAPRATGGFRYLRFHGATGKYRGRYGTAGLRPVAERLRATPGDAFVYFNNDLSGHALHDALDLSELLELPLADSLALPPPL